MRLAYAAILALVAAVFLPYSAAAAQISEGSDVLAARVAAEQELISLGISPSDAVFQVGARNYAGSDCPGSGWNCTTSATVVQINSGTTPATGGGGSNSFECTSSPPLGTSSNTAPLQKCVVVQSQTTGKVKNSARCVESSSNDPTRQICKISQTNGNGTNWAFIDQRIGQSKSMGSQIGDQVAKVRQINGTGDNQSAIVQTLNQNQSKQVSGLFGDLLQKQEAHQRAIVCQGGAIEPCDFDSNGKNLSGVAQTFNQNLSVTFQSHGVAAVIQEQNTCDEPLAAGCDFNDPAPKSLVRVWQNSTATCSKFSPCNASGLVQVNRQVATVHGSRERDEDEKSYAAFGGTVTQQQGISGNPDCTTYGVCAWVDQHTSETGVEHAIQSQDESQKLVAPAGVSRTDLSREVQEQYGPVFCCATQLPGNPNNINQTLQKKLQTATGTLQMGHMQGHCSNPGGSCNVRETLTQSGNPQSPEQNDCNGANPCGITVDCVRGSEAGAGSCAASDPNESFVPPQGEPVNSTQQCPEVGEPESPDAFCGPIITIN